MKAATRQPHTARQLDGRQNRGGRRKVEAQQPAACRLRSRRQSLSSKLFGHLEGEGCQCRVEQRLSDWAARSRGRQRRFQAAGSLKIRKPAGRYPSLQSSRGCSANLPNIRINYFSIDVAVRRSHLWIGICAVLGGGCPVACWAHGGAGCCKAGTLAGLCGRICAPFFLHSQTKLRSTANLNPALHELETSGERFLHRPGPWACACPAACSAG